jgi:hypothetical protein
MTTDEALEKLNDWLPICPIDNTQCDVQGDVDEREYRWFECQSEVERHRWPMRMFARDHWDADPEGVSEALDNYGVWTEE